MAIGGKQKEVKSFQDFEKYIGLFKAEVVAVNPDRAKMNKLLNLENADEEKEIEYTGEKDGVETARITFWLKVDGKEGVLIPYTINLKNEVRRNTAKDKIQLINCVGDSAWLEADEDNNFDDSKLFENFKNFSNVLKWELPDGNIVEKWQAGAKPHETEILGKKEFRPALVGEADLLDFMKTWLSRLDLRDTDANLLLDMDRIFQGSFKELQLVDGDFDSPFVALAYVKVDEEDPDKQYQRIFRHFLPANFIKFINNGNNMPNKFSQDKWNKFEEEVKGEYGVDGDYVLEPLKVYDPKQDVATSKSTKADVTQNNAKY